MTVAPLIAMKSTKCESLEAVGKELDSAIEDKRFELQDLGEQVEQETRRLESVRRRITEKELEPAPQTLGESLRTLWTARNDGAREEVLAGEVEGLRSRISELEGANQRARAGMEVDMNGIVAENGKVVTDEMIAGWESALERDEWPSGWVNVGEIVEGKLPKAAPETVTLSLKVPAAMKRALEKEAKAEGKSTGAYARGILADGLMAIA